jgi:hypothetical protein
MYSMKDKLSKMMDIFQGQLNTNAKKIAFFKLMT